MHVMVEITENMSQDQNTNLSPSQELWVSMAQKLFPNRSEEYICEMRMIAAAHWLSDVGNELANTYDQYVMMVRLKGLNKKGSK